MLRILVVLPIYLALIYFLPRTEFYSTLEAWVRESGERHMQLHIMGYGVGLVVSTVIALFLEARGLTEDYAVFRVLRMALAGVVVTCAYQLFLFFTQSPLSVAILFTPFLFIVAEIVYELVEHMRDRAAIA